MVASIPPASPARHRLLGLDALRGIAALSVLLYHYTTRFDQKHGHGEPLPFSFESGFLGVNLFFAISGFVIFMTLDRVRVPADFVVSRFSRLFPAFWAAIALTFTIEWLAQPLAQPIAPGQALLNVFMLHGYFGVPSVDGVYWTLQVELFFYLGMFLLWLGGALRQPFWAISAWLLASWGTWLAPMLLGRPLPHALSEALLLSHFPYFALGIAVYLGLAREVRQPRSAAVLAVLALLSVLLAEGLVRAGWALLFGIALIAGLYAGRRPRAWLRPLVWLGAISYPLYLLHQDIGYVVLQWLQAEQVGLLARIGLTTAVAIGLAALVHYAVENPAMRWLRRGLRPNSDRMPAPRRHWLVGTAGLAGALVVGSVAISRLAA
ncbi:acyltransferase family protein [Pseudomarimonas salicorniae]|uniref:Acyltransferase n=1 Tax=Pseudomarimonas salicorniae TaxID=2933270 RepID=A0ABT0GHF5_9GAMM|nr:acyltransferase [Lysobacter sp. CAU 1642]MCK7593977.1 acyltransferase [Lysobacter sp. CAU 1642]